eukprot:Lankesteria_metandrocarpae@DN5056_c0_g2_i1.p1
MDSSPVEMSPGDDMNPNRMFVVNRHGDKEPVKFEKIHNRIRRLAKGLHDLVDPSVVSQRVVSGMYSGIDTSELDELAAQTCAYMATSHPDFSKLAARIAVDNLKKNTSDDIGEVARQLYEYTDSQGRCAKLLSDDVYEFISSNRDRLNEEIDYSRDFQYDYFAFKTLEKSYLLRVHGKIVERPQHLLMRVSCGIHTGNVEAAVVTYHLMSEKYFTHATPTLFNSGTPSPQMSSCFLLTMKDDSISGIFETLKQCALISKTAGGIGLAIHSVRSTGSYIRGTNGRSNGIIPMLRVFNCTARYVDQGGGKRKGSFAIYVEPWHPDIYDFIELRKNHGKEEIRARDLFLGLWVCDLFMQRVQDNEEWTLMCPNDCPGLYDTWGAEFEALYKKYEDEGRGRKVIKAQHLWFSILQCQIETGVPYILYKDACNRKSNQQNLGTIKSSNLCTEIIEYTSPDEVAVCNLASIALPKFVKADRTFDYQKLREVTHVVTRNLNVVIDRNFYPIEEARRSNMRHRPIGLGVQGMADAFMKMRLPYESDKAREINRNIFETIYFAAMESSCDLAKEEGPYESYLWNGGCPVSKGIFQFDMWNKERRERGLPEITLSGMWDWDALREKVATHGIRNSLLLAPMPTASTSQILGNNESIEPYTSNIYSRRTLSGEFVVVNPHLLANLIEMGLWNEPMKQLLIASNGSVQNIAGIPQNIKELYKTVWEIKQRSVLDMAADRGAFIDQSQSLNIHLTEATFAKLSSMHFYGWKLGLKTGVYYLRTKAAADAIKFTVGKEALQVAKEGKVTQSRGKAVDLELVDRSEGDKENNDGAACGLRRPGVAGEDDDECVMCSG